jgi:hypothetical protein
LETGEILLNPGSGFRALPKQGTVSYCIDDLVPIVLVEFSVFRHQHRFGSTLAPRRHHNGFCRYPALLNVSLAAVTPNIGSLRFGNKFVESKMNFANETDVLFSEFVHNGVISFGSASFTQLKTFIGPAFPTNTYHP